MKVDVDSDKDSDFEVSDDDLDDEVCLAGDGTRCSCSQQSISIIHFV